jgi:outer membrane protein assembly factor BamB
MPGRFEIRKWIQVHQPVLAVVQSFDGRYIAVGLEQGVAIFNLSGHRLGDYPALGQALPVHRLVGTADCGQLYAGTRTGKIVRLDLEFQDDRVSFREKDFPVADNDLHSLSFSEEGSMLAAGHFSPGLSILRTDGQSVWRQQDSGPAAGGRTWSVALDGPGDKLYVGSGSASANHLALLNAADGTAIAGMYLDERVTGLAAIAEGKGVAVVLVEDLYTTRLVAHDANLDDILWEHVFDESVTALAADAQRAILVAGIGYGRVALMDATNGQILASERVKSVVNDLSIVEGRLVAVATQDGHVALLRYLT